MSSSPRRAYNLEPFFQEYLPFRTKEIQFKSVRGNVQTRIRKLLEGEADALVVAKAALDRLFTFEDVEFSSVQKELKSMLSELNWMVLPLSLNPCAAAQGALAIEIRRDRSDLKKYLDKIACVETKAAVEKERQILSDYGGGCHQKIGVAVLNRSYGQLTFLRGKTDQGQILNRQELKRTTPLGWPKVNAKKIFPFTMADAQFFDREELEVSSEISKERKIWVARENGLPKNYSPKMDQLVWCSGLVTWKKLAHRGFWVNGCAESLGEKEDTLTEALVPAGQWRKMTHEKGVGDERLASYRLTEKSEIPCLADKTHFYWVSFSQFEIAIKKYPEIRAGYHGCGPGHTFELLKSALPTDAKLAIFLNHESWLQEVKL